MLKEKFLAAAVLVVFSCAANALAFDDTMFYLGGEVSLLNRTTYTSANNPDVNNFKSSNSDSNLVIRKNEPGWNILAGVRFTRCLGVEIGYGAILKAKGTAQLNREATNKISNIYLDGMGYLAVAPNIELIGSVGVGKIKSSANVVGASFQDIENINQSKVGFRGGAGAQYNIDDSWSVRAMLRYQKGYKSFLTGNTSFSIGATYTFTYPNC